MEQKLRRDCNMGKTLNSYAKEWIFTRKLCAELQRRSCDIGRTTYEKYESGELNIRISVLIQLKNFITALMMTFSLVLILMKILHSLSAVSPKNMENLHKSIQFPYFGNYLYD